MRNGKRSPERTRTEDPMAIQPDSMAGGSGHEQESIARRAYELFEGRGGEHGHDQEDWFAAERELGGNSATGEGRE